MNPCEKGEDGKWKVFGIEGYGPGNVCSDCGYPLHGNETCPRLHNGCLERQSIEATKQLEEMEETEKMERMAQRVAEIILERVGKK